MDPSSLPPAFEETRVYHLASTWLNPREDLEVLAWLLILTHPDPEHRRAAVFQMWRQRDASVRVPLLVALHDPDGLVRAEAAHAMVLVPDARAVDPLLALLRDTDPSARISAVFALGQLRSVEPLLVILP